MGPLALLNHALNFAAPAIWLALLMPLCARLFIKKKAAALSWYTQAALHFVVCLAGLGAGLLLFGNDGKMLTYVGVVMLSATSQWLMLKGWRA
jgi:hypothetical protein